MSWSRWVRRRPSSTGVDPIVPAGIAGLTLTVVGFMLLVISVFREGLNFPFVPLFCQQGFPVLALLGALCFLSAFILVFGVLIRSIMK